MGALALARAGVWNDGERRPRAPVRIVGHLLLFVVVLSAFVVALAATPGPAPFETAAGLTALSVRLLVVGGAAVGATLLAVRFLDRREWRDVGLGHDTRWWRDLFAGLVLGVTLQTGIFLTSLSAGWTRVESVAGPAVLPGLLVGAALMALVGFYEELLVRGYYLVNLAEGLCAIPYVTTRRAVLGAAALTSLAFGGLHGSNPNATLLSSLLIAGYGGYLALGYLLTDDLALPVGFHAAWNYAQGFVYGFPVSGIDLRTSALATETAGPAWLTGGSFGPEAGLVGAGWVVLSLPFAWWWIRLTRGEVALRRTIAVPDLRPAPSADGDRPPQAGHVGGD